MKILIIDDDLAMVKKLKDQLQPMASYVFSASSYPQASEILLDQVFDLILCDYELSSVVENHNGMSLIKALRQRNVNTPVIFITGKGEPDITSWEALDAGADDFLKKPYRIQDLKARINAVLRRKLPESNIKEEICEYDKLKINLNTRQFFVDGKEKKLGNILFALVAYLLRHPEKVHTHTDLIEYIWGESAIYQAQSIVTLRVHIQHLKKFLGDSGDLLHSHYGHGYSFNANIEV